MDKYQATKTLTEKLAGPFGKLVVSDDNSKKSLLAKAEHSYLVGNSLDIFVERNFPKLTYIKRIDDGSRVESQKIEEVVNKIVPPEANYVFLSDKIRLDDCKCLVSLTPYALIGNKEVETIKRLFYKDYNANIREAISSLGIKDFFELYNAYFHNNEKFHNVFCNNFENFKTEVLEFLQSRTYDSSNETRLEAFETKFKIDKLNSSLKGFGVNFYLPTIKQAAWVKKYEIESLADLLKNHTPPLDKNPLNLDFLKFVFEIPYEDQNLEMNKYMLKNFGMFLDLDVVMLKEYSNGKYFKEYFELLNEAKQKDTIHIIKNIKVQNQDCNHFLWMKGSKEIKLDYLKLYKEDAQGFIDYFSNRHEEEQKVILRDIMDCDFINDKVTEWLNQNESELIREVGLNG